MPLDPDRYHDAYLDILEKQRQVYKRVCDNCKRGEHTQCSTPSEPIEGENEGGPVCFRVCCCNT